MTTMSARKQTGRVQTATNEYCENAKRKKVQLVVHHRTKHMEDFSKNKINRNMMKSGEIDSGITPPAQRLGFFSSQGDRRRLTVEFFY